MLPLDTLSQDLGQPLYFSPHSAVRQASHPNFHLLGFRASPKFPHSRQSMRLVSSSVPFLPAATCFSFFVPSVLLLNRPLLCQWQRNESPEGQNEENEGPKRQEPGQDMSRRPRGNRASVGQGAPRTKARSQQKKGQKAAGHDAPKDQI